MAGNERIRTNQLYAAFMKRRKYNKRKRMQMSEENKGILKNTIKEYIKTIQK